MNQEQQPIVRDDEAACPTCGHRLAASFGNYWSCPKCQRLMDAQSVVYAGIAGVWLFQDSGWTRYDIEDFHRLSVAAQPPAASERFAQLSAHRACLGTEHDPSNGKIHGYCVICGVPWPCTFAGEPPATPEPPECYCDIPDMGCAIHGASQPPAASGDVERLDRVIYALMRYFGDDDSHDARVLVSTLAEIAGDRPTPGGTTK